MANLVVNQWLQDAVEKACKDHVLKMMRDDAAGASISITITPMYNGLEVDASWEKYSERVFRPVWFTAKEAFEVFMEGEDD